MCDFTYFSFCAMCVSKLPTRAVSHTLSVTCLAHTEALPMSSSREFALTPAACRRHTHLHRWNVTERNQIKEETRIRSNVNCQSPPSINHLCINHSRSRRKRKAAGGGEQDVLLSNTGLMQLSIYVYPKLFCVTSTSFHQLAHFLKSGTDYSPKFMYSIKFVYFLQII